MNKDEQEALRFGEQMLDLVDHASRVLIMGHEHPDGDCVGSCLGLRKILSDRFPEKCFRVLLEVYPPEFSFLTGAEQISHDYEAEEAADLVLCLDTAEPGRLGEGVRLLEAAEHSVCVDHHITNHGYAEYNLIRPEASSASEIVGSLFPMEEIPKEAAECLYLGIVHDTGVFRYSCTGEATMRMAGAFLSKGVSSQKIIDDTFFKKTYVQNRVTGAALLSARLLADGRVIAAVSTLEEQKRLGAGKNDLGVVIDQLRITDGVEMAAFLYESEPGVFKISLRSNHIVDVSAIAGRYSGGGHVRASGGKAVGDPWKIVEELTALAEKQMENAPSCGF